MTEWGAVYQTYRILKRLRNLTEDGMSCAGTLNNVAFSIPRMRLFAASRPNSATPQTVGLVTAACLHVITKASQAFPVLCT